MLRSILKKKAETPRTKSILAIFDPITLPTIASEAGTFLFKFEEELCPKRYHQFFDKITSSNFAQFYDQNIKPYEISISEYNEALKTKILNKIQSNLRFISEDA